MPTDKKRERERSEKGEQEKRNENLHLYLGRALIMKLGFVVFVFDSGLSRLKTRETGRRDWEGDLAG